MTASPKIRLDALLVDRGLADSRERARALVLAGLVEVDGRAAPKPGTMVPLTADVRVTGPEHPWVSRGGVKLAHALEIFHVPVQGRLALDIGASTGGFTDVLLQHGAARVIALDVGHGQLDWRLRNDPRVHVIEGFNARRLSRDDLGDIGRGVDIVTVDLSFISLRLILPRLPALLAPGADIIALIKPQFEAGREHVRKGIVRDPEVHARVISEVENAAAAVGLRRQGVTPSPITGARGNQEFLLHLRA